MTNSTSKTQALSFGGRAGLAMATFTALALIAMSAAISPAHADRYDYGRDRGGWSDNYSRGGWDNRRDDRIDNRIYELRERIDDGLRRGSLTRSEAARLYGELDRIAYDARRASRSGRGIERYEYDRLDARLDRLAENLYFENHDRDYAWRRR